MRNLTAVLAFISFVGIAAFADEAQTNSTPKSPSTLKIKAAEAKEHIGTNAVVTGTIADVYIGASTINLNFGQPYPKQTFSAVIFAANTNKFTDVEKLKGKEVEVTGEIIKYHDRPEIVLKGTNQLKVIEKPVGEKQ